MNFGMISGLGTENRGEKRERKGRQSLSKERIGAIVFYFGESEKRLSSWRHLTLSFAGVCLIISVFSSLLLFYLSFFRMPGWGRI